MALDSHCAAFDFAQDEADRSCHTQLILILSEVEGRMIDVQDQTAPRLDCAAMTAYVTEP